MIELENKYIDLLLKKCINFNNSKSLFISYQPENIDFINKIVNKAKEYGVIDIYLYNENVYEKHEILKKISVNEIERHPFFNKKIWDEYALKGASFLILESEYPGLMDDIAPEKLARARYIDRITRPIYKKLQLEFKIPWCIAVLPSKTWATKLFPNINEEKAYDKLFELICEMCMVKTDNPIESWNNFLKEQENFKEKLNSLKISKLHYKNNLGTDLQLEITPNTVWHSAGSLGKDMLVNLPTYEIFTNPDFRKSNGIVFSSRPLCYNGLFIKDFYLKFKDGKVINYGAKEGKELLKGIIESDDYSSYLGEIALIPYDSPISNTNIVYGNTTFDENASCHLALGNGFPECIVNNEQLNEEELFNIGVNPSKNHVDFMIGTNDLEIEAETCKGKTLIFKKGNYNI